MTMSKTLYEQDFQVWLETTINHLHKREFADLDSDNFGVRIPPENEYPQTCPFSQEQILDENFYDNWSEEIVKTTVNFQFLHYLWLD